jgi:hypothetical protein
MPKVPITVMGYRCERCAHEWIPRDPGNDPDKEPAVCPKCKSPYWNRARKNAPAVKKLEKKSGEREENQNVGRSRVKARPRSK